METRYSDRMIWPSWGWVHIISDSYVVVSADVRARERYGHWEMDSDFWIQLWYLICLLVLKVVSLRYLKFQISNIFTDALSAEVTNAMPVFGSPVDGGQSLKMVSASYGCTSFIGWFPTSNLQMLQSVWCKSGEKWVKRRNIMNKIAIQETRSTVPGSGFCLQAAFCEEWKLRKVSNVRFAACSEVVIDEDGDEFGPKNMFDATMKIAMHS